MLLINKIKAYFNKSKELAKYHYGDIIWCYVDKYADFKFEGHHQIRPFIFLAYKKSKVYGYTMTHSIPKKHTLSYHFDNINKNNYAILSCIFVIKKKAYKGYMDKMTDKDASNVAKIIYYMQDDDNIKMDIKNKLIINENDIVSYNNELYFVYARDKDMLTLYKITNDKNDLEFITSDKGSIYISPLPLIISGNSVEYVETFKDYLVLPFKEKRKELKAKEDKLKKKNFNISSGDIFKTTNGSFVVYRVNDKTMDVIKLYSPYLKITTRDLCKINKIGHMNNQELKKLYDKVIKYDNRFNF